MMEALKNLSVEEISTIFTAERLRKDIFLHINPEEDDNTIFDIMGENPRTLKLTPEMDITILSHKIEHSLIPDSEYIMLFVVIAFGKFDKGTHGKFKVEHGLGRLHYNQDSELISMDLFYDQIHLL